MADSFIFIVIGQSGLKKRRITLQLCKNITQNQVAAEAAPHNAVRPACMTIIAARQCRGQRQDRKA